MHVFYHNDLDGQCCAAIINMATNIKFDNMIPVNHGEHFPIELINENETVYIVDFFPKREIFDKLFNITKNIIWIDHHKSSIENNSDLSYLNGIRTIGYPAACELTWKHFYNGKSIPKVVKNISLYDTWKFESYNTLKLVTSLMKTSKTIYDIRLMLEEDSLSDELYDIYLDNGNIIFEANKYENKEFILNNAFITTLDKYKIIACNIKGNAIVYLDSILNDIDFVCTFYFNGENYKYSIYHPPFDYKECNIDLSRIATTFGGGGHFSAAGFENQINIFEHVYKKTSYKEWIKN